MEVFLDGKPVDEAAVHANTLEQALRDVQGDLCPSTHVIVGIRCDGEDIVGDAMAETLLRPPQTFSRLEIFTSTREVLVVDAMTQASTSLQETETACQRVAELLHEGRTVEAVETLGECLGIWQQIHEAVGKSIQMLGLDIERTTINEEPMLELLSKPKDVLLDVKKALQAQDHVMLADVLQYEFAKVTDNWHSIIARLRQEGENRRVAACEPI